ncbi:phage tail tape measure protein [Marinomonas sp. RSW2]|uniref:Phage tail tape measure protein n=1 Tax=Marinomonas maritima TaxID=2940935 RepID=A0ABT5WGE3_9GAMM|nr:phage tail tape measure protein [Marinomonas maritima]MDE8603893.1 phage tail tape measure protein [Marinomonas maritima]
MSASLDKLMLTVGLLDKITGPMRGIQRTIQQVTNNSRKAFMNTAAGVTALIAASSTFAATINPANDMNMALGEVRSLEVADDTLKRLNQAGLKYSIEFGESASNYVRSAYDIQSAINGLSGNDLPEFTTAAGTLAKATKANVTDITSYFGTMFGFFRKEATDMGKGDWVRMLAGQTATAVQMFKTTGPKMAEAFAGLGQMDVKLGVGMNEQMAVLGKLQSSLSGSEAGTAYGAFISGLANAQEKLGVSFEDQSGKLLPTVEILKKLKAQTDGMGGLATGKFITDAFGSDLAADFYRAMSTDIDGLGESIKKLGDVTGMDKATWMAKQMQNNFARLSKAVTAISVAIWQKALPAIEPYINMMTNAASIIVDWADKYPHLTKMVGLAITAFIAFVAIAGAMNIAIGMARFAMVGFTMRFVVVRPIIWAARLAVMAYTAVIWLLKTALLAFVLYGPAVTAFFTAMKASILTSLPAIWAFTAALLANPLTWIVVGIVAIGAAIVGLIYYWDEVTEALSKGWNWLKSLFENNKFLQLAFLPLYLGIKAIDVAIKSFEKIPQWWGDFNVWLAGVTLMPAWNLGIEAFESIKKWWTDFKGWLSALDPFAFLGEKVDWLKNKMSWLPGIDASSTQEVISKVESQAETVNKSVVLPGAESSQKSGESGGLFQTISNMFGGNSRSASVEKIEVHNHGTGVSGEQLMHELEMAAG